MKGRNLMLAAFAWLAARFHRRTARALPVTPGIASLWFGLPRPIGSTLKTHGDLARIEAAKAKRARKGEAWRRAQILTAAGRVRCDLAAAGILSHQRDGARALRLALAGLLAVSAVGCGSACELPPGLVAVSDVCAPIELDACEVGPLDGTYDAACTVTIDRVCGGVTIGGQWGGELWDDAGCGYRIGGGS